MKTEVIQISWKNRLLLFLTNGIIFTLILSLTHYLLDGEAINWYKIALQGIFFGVLMAVLFPFLFGKLAKNLSNSIYPDLGEGEMVETEGSANLFRGAEAVGGKLFLTNERVIFKSHKLNINTGQSGFTYEEISDISSRKTARLVDNGLRLTLVDGRAYDFVVANRETWLDKLQEKLNR